MSTPDGYVVGMDNLPARIWLQRETDGEVTWCSDRINDDDVEYVRAPASGEPSGAHQEWERRGNVWERGVWRIAEHDDGWHCWPPPGAGVRPWIETRSLAFAFVACEALEIHAGIDTVGGEPSGAEADVRELTELLHMASRAFRSIDSIASRMTSGNFIHHRAGIQGCARDWQRFIEQRVPTAPGAPAEGAGE